MSILIAKSSFASSDEAIAYVRESEQYFREQMMQVARRVLALPKLKMLGLGGPTCAGKTTAAGLLIRHLTDAGKHVHIVSIDDFFLEQPNARDLMQEQDGHTKLDFDSFEALDFALLQNCVEQLMVKGRAVFPVYDLGRGVRSGSRVLEVKDENDIFLFEGIQTVYPQVHALLQQYPYYSMFIRVARPLCVGGVAYEPHQIRLMRRLVRDFYRRNSDPEFTFFLWNSVRTNECNNIFPYADSCDEQLDSLMGYEISMLRPYLEKILPLLPSSSAYREIAGAILHDIKTAEPLSDTILPRDSLYREFVGQPHSDV